MLTHGKQIIPERGVAMSCEPFKFRWAPTISLKRLIVSDVINLDEWSVTVVGHQFITLTADVCVEHGGR